MKKRAYAKPQLQRLGLLRQRTSMSGTGGRSGGGSCSWFFRWLGWC